LQRQSVSSALSNIALSVANCDRSGDLNRTEEHFFSRGLMTTWANSSLLQEYRHRAIALFPELQSCGHEFFASLSLYDRKSPWKFFDRDTTTKTLQALERISRTDADLLISYFRDRHGEIEVAFRSLDQINRAPSHDRDWWSLEELEMIREIREVIHPAYLQLCESVLKTFLHPIAVSERRDRGSKSESFKPDERIEEARRAGIGEFEPYDSRVRNAIAHGSVAYTKDAIEYRDYGPKGSRETTPSETLGLFEDLLDICNGLGAAFRLFVLLDPKLLFSEAAPIPPALLFPELQHQLDTAGWRVDDYLEYEYPDGQRDLNLFVATSYFDDQKTRMSVIRTAVFASRLMSSFERCYVRVDRRGGIGGWGLFETTKARELLGRGVPDGPSYLDAVPEGGFVILPLYRHFHISGPLRLIGSILEVIRTSWPVFRGRIQRPEVRHVKTVSKQTYACVTATMVLNIDDLQTAMNYVAGNVRSLLRDAVSAGWRQPMTSRWLRWLPVGNVQVDVHLRDRRRRQLLSSGLDANLLCRVVRKTRGRIPIIPLHNSVPQEIGDVRVFWNRAAMNGVTRESSE
jgi:hypothetical protein